MVCAALLIYTAVFSFWHPMVPGVMNVVTTEFKPGLNEFNFIGYNTHFQTERKNLKLYVTCDNHTYFCTEIVDVKSENEVVANVILPDTISTSNFSFYANTPTDGTVHFNPPVISKGFVLAKTTSIQSCDIDVVSDEHIGFGYPFQPIIIESIRNLMWHVPMWFTMFTLMIMSFIFSLMVLTKGKKEEMLDVTLKKSLSADLKAAAAASTGMIFCILGLVTGSVWARFTWGTWWVSDPQLNGAMVVFIVYAAYFILRSSIPDEEKKARLSAIFNIFAFVLMVVLLMVMPRFTEGLHPGKSGNPAFSKYDLDSSLRTVFYPACAGFILLGYWLYNILFRIKKLESDYEI